MSTIISRWVRGQTACASSRADKLLADRARCCEDLAGDLLRLRHRARYAGELDRVIELRIVAVHEREGTCPCRHRTHLGRIEGHSIERWPGAGVERTPVDARYRVVDGHHHPQQRSVGVVREPRSKDR